MSDSAPDNLSGGGPRQKTGALLVVLILAAIIVGLAIWRFKTPTVPTPTAAAAPDTISPKSAPVPEPAKPESTAMAATPAPTPAAPATAPVESSAAVSSAPATEAAAPPVPENAPVAKIHHHHKIHFNAPETTGTVAQSEPAPIKAKPEVKPVPAAQPLPVQPPPVQPPVEQSPVVVAKPPVPAKPAPVEQPVATPTPVPAQPPKKFAMEDQVSPGNTPLSEDGQLAMNTLPKATEAPSEAVAAAPEASDVFKQGTMAYHDKDYAGAISLFGKLPKPATRQQGDPVRDQYVEGNMLLGISLLHVDRANDAVGAFLTVLDYDKYRPVVNMNLGICYVELKQYFKADKSFQAVIRDQGYIDSSLYDDVMERTKYFWALAWTRMYKASTNADKQAYYQQQAILRWKDYQTWFGKNEKYHVENRRAEDYLKSLSAM